MYPAGSSFFRYLSIRNTNPKKSKLVDPTSLIENKSNTSPVKNAHRAKLVIGKFMAARKKISVKGKGIHVDSKMIASKNITLNIAFILKFYITFLILRGNYKNVFFLLIIYCRFYFRFFVDISFISYYMYYFSK